MFLVSFNILLSNGAFLDFLLIYAFFPQNFLDWKAESANFSAFKMYAS